MGFVAQLVEVSHLGRRESSIVDREMRVNNLPPSRRAETDKKCSVLTYNQRALRMREVPGSKPGRSTDLFYRLISL